ncbi:(d)CMP kinase [Marinicrinis sediminis]|uniref:Cytidylate kinase n=1 Tax=Marinicrinis sediminis TaxID=1652465 RepID=A0ABW5RCX6_9BACL
MSHNGINIAIDGPAGAGKSTVARLVAEKLGMVYIDTGAMYRAITWKVLQEGRQAEDDGQVARIARELRIRLEPSEQGQKVFADDQDITSLIREPAINQQVSTIAQHAAVREQLTLLQQQMASGKGVIMDGRDIGTKVLPDAEIKIFLTASVEERARRRFEELRTKYPDLTLEKLKEEIAQRDHTDETRKESPLTQAQDAIEVDTTGMSLSDVTARILEIAERFKS